MKSKKNLIAIISVVILVVVIIATGTISYAYEVAKKNSIGIDKALNIAMIDAGAQEDNTTVTKAKLELEKSMFVYDIEFVVNNVDEYDYTIKASDGTVLDVDHELDDDRPVTTAKVAEISSNNASETTKQENSQTTKNSDKEITLEEAKNIALSSAGVSKKDATFTSAHKDSDDGITYYDIEFVTSTTEYDYEIGLDGKVISYDMEAVSPQGNKTTKKQSSKTTKKSGSEITLEEAKNIALKNAGVSKKDATFTSAHKDSDDGITHYEIEFKTSSYKYEYEISMNGEIISFDKDAIKKSDKNKTTAKSSASAKYIGVDSAKKIALKDCGFSAKDVVFTKAKLEKDDGIYIYEIEFETSTTEYEYEINATTGKILDKSSEPID